VLQLVQAFDRIPFAEVGTDDASLEAKLDAVRAFRNRDSWPKSHELRATVPACLKAYSWRKSPC
jgi:hypothetical protein